MTIAEEHNKTIEIPLTDEIKELGISRVYKGIDEEDDILKLYVIRSEMQDKPFKCVFDESDFKKTAKEIETVLNLSGFGEKNTKKFIVLLSKLVIKLEQERKQARRAQILTEIRKRRKEAKFSSVEQWQEALSKKYNELHDTVLANFPEIWSGLEFELSILRILNIHGNTLPFIGLLLARAGSGKTQIINLINEWYCTYYTDDFSPRSLVSHSTALTEEELQENDLLPQMKNRLLLTPELAPIFTIKDEDLAKTIGIITRIADGDGYYNNSGAHGRRGYGGQDDKLMFTWLGATVDMPYRVYKMLSHLGFKLYFFRLPYKEETEDDLLLSMSDDFNEQMKAIRTILYEYLYLFEMGPHLIYDNELNKVKWNNSRDNVDAKKYIVKLGILIQYLRCIVSTWHTEGTQGSEYGYSVSQPEAPKRAIRALFNLAKGHALLTGRNYITLEDVPIVIKTVLSTALIDRVGLLFLLIENGGKASTDEIMNGLNVTRHTALRTMTELKVIGLVEMYEQKGEHDTQYTKHIRLKDNFTWFLTEEFDKLREGFIPVDNREFMHDPRRKGKGDKKANEEKITPYTHEISTEQYDEFMMISEEMQKEQLNDYSMMEADKNTFGGEILKTRLVASGKFTQSQAESVIDVMLDRGIIEKVSYDTYRKKEIG